MRPLCAAVLLLSLPPALLAEPVPVKLVKGDDGYSLVRGGKPYFVRGAGGSGSTAALTGAGANSVRTWGVEGLGKVLDDAQAKGLTVCVGVWLGHERHGFSYTDVAQVTRQAEAVREAVTRYRSHPAVLLWALGNEMEGAGENAAVWGAINNLATMVKKLDPDHPTMTVVAEIGGAKVKHLHALCPDIDIVGINSYAGATSLPARYREAGGTKPYIVTEFGPPGMWESPKTPWGSPVELTSTEKAERYRTAYTKGVLAAKGQCLGSYAFIWGTKQEATATWFGMMLPDGTRLGAVDVMNELWSGKPPTGRCPEIASLKLAGPAEVEAGAVVRATLEASDPPSDAGARPLEVKWVLQREPWAYGEGGDAEEVPPTFPAAIVKGNLREAEVKMPAGGGGYRLFAYVRDGRGGAAVGNVALRVKGEPVLPAARKATLPLVVQKAGEKAGPFVPSGWMGNAKGTKLDESAKDAGGAACARIDYEAKDGWAGIVWQSPAGDWGDRPGGVDLRGATKLTFRARGAKGGEVVSFEFGLLGKDKKFPDTGRGKLAKVRLTDEWTRYTIELKGQDLSRVKTGFACVWEGGPLTFYLDDVRFE